MIQKMPWTNSLRTLLRADFRLITRDGIVFMTWLGPLALLGFLAAAVPFAQRYLDVTPYLPWVAGLVSALVPFIPGTGVGFLILDEMDQGLVRFYSVSPLGLRGYMLYRLAAAWLPGFVYLAMMPVFLPWLRMDPAVYIGHTAAAALGAPLMGLALASLAGNRVEGLALSKGLGVVLAAPFLPFWLPEPWWRLALLLPPYWTVQTMRMAMDGTGNAVLALSANALCHCVWLGVFLRKLRYRG